MPASTQETGITVQLEWPPEVVERVTDEARQAGLFLDAGVSRNIDHREVSEKLIPGPDLTIRDLTEEGRRF